jgi:hypothetical protein
VAIIGSGCVDHFNLDRLALSELFQPRFDAGLHEVILCAQPDAELVIDSLHVGGNLHL